MTCRPELVTGHVDGALDPAEEARVAAHLAACAECRAQADAERSLRAGLRSLPAPEVPFGLEQRLRERLWPTSAQRGTPRARRWPARTWVRTLLPLAAGLAVLALWLRGSPSFVALELVFDHVKCFRTGEPPAKVSSGDVATVVTWFESQGTVVPDVPSRAAGLELRGARYCPLLDGTSVAHLYYMAGSRHVSLFVIPRALRLSGDLATTRAGRTVRLLTGDRQTIAIVSESGADADALASALHVRIARSPLGPLG